MLRNTKEQYGSINKFFHWTMAFLIITMLCVGFFMSGPIVNIHKLTGLLILTLVALRLIWKLLNPVPELPETISRFEKILARSAEGFLYLCMFAMPLSGWAMATSFGYSPHLGSFYFPMPGISVDKTNAYFFKSIHDTLAWVFIGFISLHILGALKHLIIDKDSRVLKSMWRTKLTGRK
jgi:cytochrome b561